MFKFPYPENWLFLFCLNCWNYQRIIFNEKINWKDHVNLTGICEKCQNEQNVNLKNIKDFYLQQTEPW